MRTLLYILQKEFTQILRDKRMLGIILMVPILQMLILVYAANMDVKNVDFVVVDQDQSQSSRELINKFSGSPFFNCYGTTFREEEAEALLKNDKADMIIKIPSRFEETLVREGRASLQLIMNAINGTAAEISSGYAQNVIMDYNREIIAETYNLATTKNPGVIKMTNRYWYNDLLDYKHYMAPGILVILVTIIGMFLSGMNLVKEKEIGTTEQLNVTPIQKWQLIAGKLIPFWVIALFDLAFGLLIARIFFHLPIEGNLLVLFSYAAVYLVGVLGAGLLISTFANTQQQVLFIGFFFVMIFVLMGGIFTPVQSMPDWAQFVDKFNPVCYFMEVTRMVLLKGSGFADITKHFTFSLIFGFFMLTFSIVKYRKRA
ncbi:MAG TPA: ABC transporter permease [Prolixibacteraceae bacterium]|nr:ABC transporter permease [Prolixibacteraceae bacterium]HPS12145.1 ABC transporter permease [Prolixibacteraceae bacterium]